MRRRGSSAWTGLPFACAISPKRGRSFIRGDIPCDGNWREALEKAASAIGWGTPLAKGHGRGIALGLKISATYAASYCILRLHYDGSASLLTGTSDMGQGARTVFAQIVAQEMGLSIEQVAVVMGDTAVVPYDTSTSASRSTVIMGSAVRKACQEVKDQMRSLAAELFAGAGSEINVAGGRVRWPRGEAGFAELLRDYYGTTRGEIIGVGSFVKRKTAGHPLAGQTVFYELSCSAAEVSVDEETGMIWIPSYVTVGDVGKALNPQHVEMQDSGAAIMGLGHTLMEHIILDGAGRIVNLGRPRLPYPHHQGHSRFAGIPDRGERGRAGALRGQGDRGGRAACNGSRGRVRGSRGNWSSHSRPAVDTGEGLAGNPGKGPVRVALYLPRRF